MWSIHWLQPQLNPVDLRIHLACLLVLWCCVPTYGTPPWSAMLAGEGRLSPASAGHGIARLAYNHSGLPSGGHLQLEYNTDTVRLDISQLRWGDTGIEWGMLVAGQWRYAGLLPDYYLKDRRLPARGFHASSVQATVRAKANLPAHHAIEFHLGLRRWLFSRTAETNAALQLPPDASVLEARIWHTYWRIAPDTAAEQSLNIRVRGIALTTQLGLDMRSESRAWGARNPLHFNPVDRSNDPGAHILLVRQWLRAGRQVSFGHRIQLQALWSWGRGEDDLTRMRIGGMTPYVVPVGGLPWPAHLGERVASTTISLHRRVGATHEAGVFVDAVSFVDFRRTGKAQRLARFGGGIFFDGPWRGRHVDARLGWSPPNAGQPQQISIFVALGQVWN